VEKGVITKPKVPRRSGAIVGKKLGIEREKPIIRDKKGGGWRMVKV